MRYLLLLVLFLAAQNLFAQKPPKVAKKYIATDSLNVQHGPLPYNYEANMKYKKVVSESMYLTMRDSVKIAINLVLPKGLEAGEKIPTVLYQTRYWRGAKFRFPFSMFLNNFSGKQGKMIKDFIRCGYALIAVDARGSGASMGSRKHPWTEDEVKDGAEIVDWAIAQPWSNGKVGSSGISYSGTTAEFLATTMHPAVKAVAPMFSLYDVYDDISLPGGVQLEYFTKNWGAANWALDNNKLPVKKLLPRMAVKGVQPVKGQKKMIKEAVKQHQANLNVNDGVESLVYRDDISKVDGATGPDKFSPHSFSHVIDKAGVAVYSVSGYFDGDYQHAAVKRFLTLNNPQNKLLLGPWEHGGWMNCSHFNPGPSGFSKTAELLKYFDYHLKGIETGINKEPRVHYYTMGEEKWKSSNTWPPQNTRYTNFYFNEKAQLNTTAPPQFDSFTPYTIDSSFGTGTYSRWRSLMGKLEVPFPYFDWNERSASLPHFQTTPFTENVEVTGHGVVVLYVASTATDGAFIAYLEDIDENGKASYITEGEIRALHRKVSDDPRAHKDVEEVPHHTYLKKDGEPLTPGKVEKITFDLLPVSYQFKKGHSLRVSLSGYDKDHFRSITPVGEWKIYHSTDYPSYISLPVIRE
jgi:uncharacterized protein